MLPAVSSSHLNSYPRKRIIDIVKLDGNNLEIVPLKYQKDKVVVLAAARENPKSLKFAHVELFHDHDFILISLIPVVGIKIIMKYASNSFKKNKKCMEILVRNCGLNLKYADVTLQDNESFVTDAISNESDAAITRRNGNAIQYASDRLKYSLAEKAVSHHGRALRFLPEECKNTEEIVLKAIMQNGRAIEYANKKFIAQIAVANDGTAIEFLNEELKKDPDIIEIAEQT